MTIHPTAIIDPTAKVGKNVSVGAHAVIGPDVELGDGCRIWPNAVLEHVTLGANCEVYPGACLGLPAQHTRYKGEPARVVAGSGNVFREGVTVHRGTPFDHSVTTIGDNCYFMAMSHVAHDCRVGSNVTMANGSMLGGHVEIGDNVFISGMAACHQYVRIGKAAMIGGGAMVVMDVAPFCIAQGDRAVLRGLNVVGMRRLGLGREELRQVKEAFKAVFMTGERLEDAINGPALNVDSPSVRLFRDFLKESKRGYIRPMNLTPEEEKEIAS